MQLQLALPKRREDAQLILGRRPGRIHGQTLLVHELAIELTIVGPRRCRCARGRVGCWGLDSLARDDVTLLHLAVPIGLLLFLS